MIDLTQEVEVVGQKRKRTYEDIKDTNHLDESFIEVCRLGNVKLARQFHDRVLCRSDAVSRSLDYHNYEWYRVAAAEGHMKILKEFEDELQDELSVNEIADTVAPSEPRRFFRYLAFEEACRYGHLDVAKHLLQCILYDEGDFEEEEGYTYLDEEEEKRIFVGAGEYVERDLWPKCIRIAEEECVDQEKGKEIAAWLRHQTTYL